MTAEQWHILQNTTLQQTAANTDADNSINESPENYAKWGRKKLTWKAIYYVIPFKQHSWNDTRLVFARD